MQKQVNTSQPEVRALTSPELSEVVGGARFQVTEVILDLGWMKMGFGDLCGNPVVWTYSRSSGNFSISGTVSESAR